MHAQLAASAAICHNQQLCAQLVLQRVTVTQRNCNRFWLSVTRRNCNEFLLSKIGIWQHCIFQAQCLVFSEYPAGSCLTRFDLVYFRFLFRDVRQERSEQAQARRCFQQPRIGALPSVRFDSLQVQFQLQRQYTCLLLAVCLFAYHLCLSCQVPWSRASIELKSPSCVNIVRRRTLSFGNLNSRTISSMQSSGPQKWMTPNLPNFGKTR